VVIELFKKDALDQRDSIDTPADDLIDILQQVINFFPVQRLVDAAGNRTGTVDTLTGGEADYFLAIFAQQNTLFCDFGVVLYNADDVPVPYFIVESE